MCGTSGFAVSEVGDSMRIPQRVVMKLHHVEQEPVRRCSPLFASSCGAFKRDQRPNEHFRLAAVARSGTVIDTPR